MRKNNRLLSVIAFLLLATFLVIYVLPNTPSELDAYPKSKQCLILPIKFDANADGKVTISDIPDILKKAIRYPGRLAVLKLESTAAGEFLEITSTRCSGLAEQIIDFLFWSLAVVLLLGATGLARRNLLILIDFLLQKTRVISINYHVFPFRTASIALWVCLPIALIVIWVALPITSSVKVNSPRSESSSNNAQALDPLRSRPNKGVSTDGSADVHEVLRLTNEARNRSQTCGNTTFEATDALESNEMLMLAAQGHAGDMLRQHYFSHTSQDGRQLADRVNERNYSWRTIGENIAKGQRSPKEVVADWLRSPGHCKNLMNPDFKEIGIARSGSYWVQVFAAPK